jgi:hypothetical protein
VRHPVDAVRATPSREVSAIEAAHAGLVMVLMPLRVPLWEPVVVSREVASATRSREASATEGMDVDSPMILTVEEERWEEEEEETAPVECAMLGRRASATEAILADSSTLRRKRREASKWMDGQDSLRTALSSFRLSRSLSLYSMIHFFNWLSGGLLD